MSYLQTVLSPPGTKAQVTWGSPFWSTGENYQPSAAGVDTNPDAAMCLRSVYRCVSLLAGIAAVLPLNIYRRINDGKGREVATSHPLYRLFAQLGPNRWQTAEAWVKLTVAHLEMRGNSYNRVIAGPRGIVDQLVPLHPARVTPEVNNRDGRGWIDARLSTLMPDGSMRYVVMGDGLEREILTEEEVFHIRGLSSNGVLGLSRVSLMREAVGLSLATEGYGSRFFSQNASPRGVYKLPGKLDNDAYERLRNSIESETGLKNAHKTKILEQGAEWQAIGLSNEDSQFLETRKFQVADIAGWFGVPPHLIGDVDRSTSWGTGLAEQNLALLTYTVAPILECIEQAIDKELILADRTYFAEFDPDRLMRTDPKARAEALATKRQNGVINANEWRQADNMNPIEGPEGEAYLVNSTMVPVSKALAPDPAPPAPPREDPSREDPAPDAPATPPPSPAATRAAAIVRETAGQIVRKEVRWVQTWAPRLAADPEGWRAKVTAFYDRHAETVTERLHLTAEAAADYCGGQAAALATGISGVESWAETVVPRLTALALGGEDAPVGTLPAAPPIPTVSIRNVMPDPAPAQIEVHAHLVEAPRAKRMKVLRDTPGGPITGFEAEE